MKKKLAGRLLLCAAVLAGAWLVSTGIVTWRLLHRALPAYPEPVPDALAGEAQSLTLATRDGETLGAWWSGAREPRFAALLLHGNGGSRREMAGLMEWLAAQRIATLAISLRAHGDSSGAANDLGWSAREDVVCGVEFLERRVPHARILIIGRSLGAAAAVFAARELGTRVSAYVLEAPYRDLSTAARHRLRIHLPGPLDCVAWAGMRLWSGWLLPVGVAELSPLERVRDIPAGTPILFLSGTGDEHAPLAEVEEIARRVPDEAQIVRFVSTGHAGLFGQDPGRFEGAILPLLARLGSTHSER